ncbi:MAG: DUF5814 domain-containing protein [Methanomicrobiales archaeon]|nr:DUF5814 domain-containing protein [Methanomicrobiales archaeon]
MIADKARLKSKRRIERFTGYRLPDQAFHGTVIEAITSRINFSSLDGTHRDQILAFIQEFCRCNCRDSPFCGCPERAFAKLIVELRENGLDHKDISRHLVDTYGIEIYPADVLGFLEESVHVLEAVRDIARLEGKEETAVAAAEHIALISR